MSNSTYQKNIFDSNHRRSTVKRFKTVRILLFASVLCLLADAGAASGQTVSGSQCVRANPTVTIVADSQSVFPGNHLTLKVTVTNNDSAGCPPSMFVTMPTFPEVGFVHKPDCLRSTLSPGESQTRTATIKVPGAACVGPRTLRETTVSESVAGGAGFADVNFKIVPLMPDCGRAAPTVTIEPVSAKPLVLGAPTIETVPGGQVTYKVSVTNNDAPVCGWSEFTVTPNLPPGLIMHTPASFRLSAPPGGTASRPVVVQSAFSVQGSLVFTESAAHSCATCLVGSAPGTFTVAPQRESFAGFCCTGVLSDPRSPSRVTFTGCREIFQSGVCQGFTVLCGGTVGLDPDGNLECN